MGKWIKGNKKTWISLCVSQEIFQKGTETLTDWKLVSVSAVLMFMSSFLRCGVLHVRGSRGILGPSGT